MTILSYYGTMIGTRACCRSGKESQITLEWTIVEKVKGYLAGETWLHLRGGPTGYESVQIDAYHISLLRERGWHACGGTPDRWDALHISVEEMNRVLDEILGKDCIDAQ